MLLVVIDAHSKWIEAIPLKTANALTTIRQLRKLFAQFGIPNTLVSDNGPQFAAVEFHEFCHLNGIRHTRVAPYHPSSNGLAERAMRVVKDGLKKQQGDTLLDQLSRLLFQYKITPQTTTSIAPAELLLGRKPRSRLDILKPTVEERVQGKQQQQKTDHDKRSKVRQFAVEERVFVQNHGRGDRWLPGIITGASGPLSFKVDIESGRTVKCHQDPLRKRGEVNIPVTQELSEDDSDLFLDLSGTTTPTGSNAESTTPQDVGGDTSTQPRDTARGLSTAARPPRSGSSASSGTTEAPTAAPPPQTRTYPSRNRNPPNWYHNQYC